MVATTLRGQPSVSLNFDKQVTCTVPIHDVENRGQYFAGRSRQHKLAARALIRRAVRVRLATDWDDEESTCSLGQDVALLYHLYDPLVVLGQSYNQ